MIGARSALLVAAALLLGCPGPGEIADPSLFQGACPDDFSVEGLLQDRCAGSVCHGSDAETPGGGLDLISPDVASRLVGVTAVACDSHLRIDRVDPESSLLLLKLTAPPAQCGDPMPLASSALSREELDCVRAWVTALASGPAAPDGGVADAGPSDGGGEDAGEPDSGAADAAMDAAATGDGGGS